MPMTPDQRARLIFNGVSRPLLGVAALALVLLFTGRPIAGGITAVVFAALIVFLLVVVRPLIFRKVREVSTRPRR